jgi:putative hemolysin
MELLIIIGLMILNGVFALSEMAIVSVRKSRLQMRADNGDKRATLALELANNPEKMLATIQIGITLIGILAGAFGGAIWVDPLSETLLSLIPALGHSVEVISVAFVVSLTTYLSLVIGELVPKQLALQNAETISLFTAYPLDMLSKIVSPLVWILNISTKTMIRIIGITPSQQETITQGEIISLIRKGVDVGVFDTAEEDLVRNVMSLDEQRIASFVTPRIDIVMIRQSATNDEIRDVLMQYPFTTYPIVVTDFDNVQGIVSGKNIVPYLIQNQPVPLDSLMLQPLFVPENISASRLLKQFKSSGIHTAIVIDEYGSNIGLIRLHDLIEQIVGEIDGGEFDKYTDPDIVMRDDGSYYVDGLLPLTQLMGLFDNFSIPEDDTGGYDTLAGFIMERLQRIPTVADQFEYEGLHFEIVDMDGKHIDKVLITNLN